jgi:hypothetical protein
MGDALNNMSLGEDDVKATVTATKGKPQQDIIKEMTRGKLSPHNAKIEGIRKAPRTRIGFTNIPVPIKEAFEAEAEKHGMGLKDFLYYCMRAGGVDIPENQELDARKK